MIIAYTEEEFNKAKTEDLLQLKCKICDQIFKKTKKEILRNIRYFGLKKLIYCSIKCMAIGNDTRVKVKCNQCSKEFLRQKSVREKYPTAYCSHSCSATYNNKNKTHGTRRSKLEIYLEDKLKSLYPDLEIHCNRKDTINSELDFYFPSLNLAFELNGIFHYEPIYGEIKLKQIQNNDGRKFQACLEKGIELCIVDSSKMSYFKDTKAKPFLDIFKGIIDEKLSNLSSLPKGDLNPPT